jgi:hypothetical protein
MSTCIYVSDAVLESVGTFEGTYTAKQVPPHGTAFVRVSKKTTSSQKNKKK